MVNRIIPEVNTDFLLHAFQFKFISNYKRGNLKRRGSSLWHAEVDVALTAGRGIRWPEE